LKHIYSKHSAPNKLYEDDEEDDDDDEYLVEEDDDDDDYFDDYGTNIELYNRLSQKNNLESELYKLNKKVFKI
jgi:hypothetical protein